MDNISNFELGLEFLFKLYFVLRNWILIMLCVFNRTVLQRCIADAIANNYLMESCSGDGGSSLSSVSHSNMAY